jgi:hypothetical protein
MQSQEECRIWLYGYSMGGYPIVGVPEVGVRTVHTLVCELTEGPKPFKKAHAAHSCGVKSCWNAAHIRWATPAENSADRLAHANTPGKERDRTANLKLMPDQVRRIRNSYAEGSITQRELGEHFGVSQDTISRIVNRKTWDWLD